MLFQIFKLDETSKSSAFKVSLFNLFVTLLLTFLLVGFVSVVFEYYDEITAKHVSRLIWVEAGLNFLFLPFAVVLAVGIKKDKYKWIRVWIKVKVVQASYIFLLNFVMQVYITASLNFGDGLVVLVYTLIVEVFYMENIIFMNNYYRSRVEDNSEDNTEPPPKIPENLVLKF